MEVEINIFRDLTRRANNTRRVGEGEEGGYGRVQIWRRVMQYCIANLPLISHTFDYFQFCECERDVSLLLILA